MDWDHAIERHRAPLLRIVASLFAMIGLAEEGTVERLAWPLYRAVLRVLRPAESAVRRLIILAARDIEVEPSRKHSDRAKPAGKGRGKGKRTSKCQGRRSFQLFDPSHRRNRPRKDAWLGPHVGFLAAPPKPTVFQAFRPPPPVAPPPAPAPDHTVNAQALCRRLAAIKAALEDLAYQARRYARWRARPVEERRPKRASALRSGDPPGYRQRPSHEVDHILGECDWLALSMPQPDTS